MFRPVRLTWDAKGKSFKKKLGGETFLKKSFSPKPPFQKTLTLADTNRPLP